MASRRIPVWLDCDPGHDDAFAILLAAYHPSIELLGISTVFGNTSLDNTTRNAAAVLTAIGKQDAVPLHAGRSSALTRPALTPPTDIHGASGLDGTELLPTPRCSLSPVPAIDAMTAALLAQPPATAWIVATGALTNVADTLRRHPALAKHLAGLSVMGGAIGGGFTDAPLGHCGGRPRTGNITPFAEFNIFIDPEAAAEVLGCPELARKTTLVPLDLTHQVLATPSVRNLVLHGPRGGTGPTGKTNLRTMLSELLYFFAKAYSQTFGVNGGPPLHDPLAVAAVLIGTRDEIPFFEWDPARSKPPKHHERFAVHVDTEGSFEDAMRGAQTGRTTAEELPPGQEGVRIPRGVDVAKFWHVLEECIERADEANARLAS